MINSGESYILDITPSVLRKYTDTGKIRATTDYAVLSEIDAVAICVPTPCTKPVTRICLISLRQATTLRHICTAAW